MARLSKYLIVVLLLIPAMGVAETIEVDRERIQKIRDDASQSLEVVSTIKAQLEELVADTEEVLAPPVVDPLPQVPVPALGWTVLKPSPDSRTIYVANPPMGDDGNSGLAPDDPVATPERGYQLMRDGFPDWLLFKAGDEFSELPTWLKSGRSKTERMVIGAYGDGPRPVFTMRLNSTYWRPSYGDLVIRHLAFVGLHARRSDDGKSIGLRWLMASEDILIEDCKFEGFRDNLVIQADWPKYEIRDVAIRRSIVIDASSPDRGQGLYAVGVRGLLIEDSIFDRNGLNPGTHDPYNHNLYIATANEDVVIRNTISTRAASHGLQLRPGGVVTNSLFALNPIGLFVTHTNSEVTNNVVLFGADMQSSEVSGAGRRGWGLQIGTGDSDLEYALVENNIIAWNRGSQRRAGIEVSSRVKKVDLIGNIVHDWHRSSGVAIDVRPNQVGIDKDNRTVSAVKVDPIVVEANVIELIAQERTRPRGAWYRGADWEAREVLE